MGLRTIPDGADLGEDSLVRVTSSEGALLGGVDRGGCVFGFCAGDMRPMPVSRFQPSGFLSYGYYADCMGKQQEWTSKAGYVVLGYLTGRLVEDEIVAEIIAGWGGDWQEQLSILKQLEVFA